MLCTSPECFSSESLLETVDELANDCLFPFHNRYTCYLRPRLPLPGGANASFVSFNSVKTPNLELLYLFTRPAFQTADDNFRHQTLPAVSLVQPARE